jgi:eukaryotic-like serine/threonine-protein kinase
MPLSPGIRLGAYEIVAPLGAGGMGEVYKARDTRLDRTVAIKILPADAAADPHRQERFRREARAISSLPHPHICALYDIGRQDGVDFLVMEHLSGETLAHRLLRGPLPLEEVMRNGAQVADALDAAHRHGLIHRDLKPANIMLTASGAKILDFGLAKRYGTDSDAAISVAATGDATLTQVGTVVGTIQYMAPEQVEGRPADARSDIFALGAILYEMTTGRKAFDGASQAAVVGAILRDELSPLSRIQPLTPPALDRLVARCVAKIPEERWQTAKDLLEELKWVRESRSQAVGPSRRTVNAAERVTWAAAVAALLIALVAAATLLVRRAPAPPEAIRFAISAPAGGEFGAASAWENRAGDPFGESFVAVSPNGRSVAFVASRHGTSSLLWVRNLEAVDAQSLMGTDEARMPFWSPDSRLIGFFAQGKLKTVDTTSGPPHVLCDAPAGEGGTWNRDGTIVFAPTATGPLFRISATGGGEPRPVTTLDRSRQEVSHRWPVFLPDGRHFIYLVHQPAAIHVASLDSPQTKRLVPADSKALYAPPGYLLFVRQHAIVAQPFDAARLETTGDPFTIADRVKTVPALGHADFSVSENAVLAFQTGDIAATRLAWFDRTGRQLSTIGEEESSFTLKLSPDERLVAVGQLDPQLRQGIWLFDVGRGVKSRFTFDEQNSSDPAWSPDGRQIAFTSERRGPGTRNIYVRTLTTGKEDALLESDERKVPDDWSSDGRFLAYTQAGQTTGRSGLDIWVLPLFGERRPFAFLVSSFYKGHPRFSPDGRWLAYDSDESGRFEVYVQAFPGPGEKLRVSTNSGAQPLWRQDGKELFYLSRDGSVMALSVNTDPALELGTPTVLFHSPLVNPVLPQYGVADNGRRFLFLEPAGDASRTPITVVLNWQSARGARESR